MKKAFFIFSSLIVTAAIFCSCSAEESGENKPFAELQSSDIHSASVQLLPPDEMISITEPKELTALLHDVVIYEEDNSYSEYDGQSVIFTLEKTDGTTVEIMAYDPFVVIDGIGYKCEYEPCEALNRYTNDLLNENMSV
ncbi:hypothetical protein [Ruminococcus sp.]|uniref:hypothetical protein n=1 Tax=Ruminococcus sp. TaxID=41978 RepID=UPI0025DA7280|nr:hypothetical protein [Ruminococcus sp.]